MTDKPEKKKREEKKPTVFKTDDELIDELFGSEVRKKLKEVAHDARPKERSD